MSHLWEKEEKKKGRNIKGKERRKEEGIKKDRRERKAEGSCKDRRNPSPWKDLTLKEHQEPLASKTAKSKKKECELPLTGPTQGQHNW